MKYTGTLCVPALGLSVAVEVELEPAAVPAAVPETLTDEELRARWRRSARTLKRLRDSRRLPFLQPSPRTFLYRLADVREYEATYYRGASRRAVRLTA